MSATGVASVGFHPSGARSPHPSASAWNPGIPLPAIVRRGSGGQRVHADPVRAEVAREVPGDRFERGLGHAHPVVDRPRDAARRSRARRSRPRAPACAAACRSRSPSASRRSSGSRSPRSPTACCRKFPPSASCGANAIACRNPSSRPHRDPISAETDSMCAGSFASISSTSTGFGSRRADLLGQPHRAAERGQDDLGALLLQGLRRRVRDRLARQHAGDEQLLAFEQHRDLLGRPACYC